MKKMFLLATLALSCVFASCSKDDDDDTKTEKNQVAFGTKIGNPIELTPADSCNMRISIDSVGINDPNNIYNTDVYFHWVHYVGDRITVTGELPEETKKVGADIIWQSLGATYIVKVVDYDKAAGNFTYELKTVKD